MKLFGKKEVKTCNCDRPVSYTHLYKQMFSLMFLLYYANKCLSIIFSKILLTNICSHNIIKTSKRTFVCIVYLQGRE